MTAPATDSLSGIVAGLSDSQRMWLFTVSAVPMPTNEAREHVYGPDWHSSENWPRLCKDQDDLIRSGLITQTLPLKHSVTLLTPLGLAVKQHMEKES